MKLFLALSVIVDDFVILRLMNMLMICHLNELLSGFVDCHYTCPPAK